MIDRRTLLAATTGTLALASCTTTRRVGFGDSRPLGVQLYTVGDAARTDLAGTLQRLQTFGYETVELAGLAGHTPEALRAAAKAAGVRYSAIHLQVKAFGASPNLDDDAVELARQLAPLGVTQVVLPLFPFPPGVAPDWSSGDFATALSGVAAAMRADDWKRTAKYLNERGKALRDAGLRLTYHNHNPEFAPLDGTTGWQILMAETDPGLVDVELDLGWVAAAGLDPVEVMQASPGRITMLHVKDVAAATVPNFAFRQTSASVGKGIIDWPRVLAAAARAGVRDYIVEQEPPYPDGPFEALAQSADYLLRGQ